MEELKEFKDRLRKARIEKNISQVELGRLTGASQSKIAALESGRNKKPTNIIELSEILGVSAYWLETGKGDMHASIPPHQDEIKNIHRPMLWSSNDPLPEDDYTFAPYMKEQAFCGGAGSFEIPDPAAQKHQPRQRVLLHPHRRQHGGAHSRRCRHSRRRGREDHTGRQNLRLPPRRPVPRQIPQPPAGRARQNQKPQSGLRRRRSGTGRHRGHRPRLLVERVGLKTIEEELYFWLNKLLTGPEFNQFKQFLSDRTKETPCLLQRRFQRLI